MEIENNIKQRRSNVNKKRINKQKNKFNNSLIDIFFITEINYYDFKIIRKEINKKINRKYRINYLNINNIKLKIKNISEIKNIIFFINAELSQIELLNQTINLIKLRYLIENKNINIIITFKKSKHLIDYYLLKSVFKKYNVIKLKRNKNDFFIDEKIINKINLV